MDKVKMPNDTWSFIQRIQEYGLLNYVWILFLSIWAGTARYLTSLNGKKPTFLGWLTETVVSGFVGIIAGMTCYYYELAPLLTYVITGIAAHNGTRSLYLIGEILKKNGNPISEMIDQPKQSSGSLARKGDPNE